MASKHSIPGRPRSFDEAVALTAAMKTFWAKGFDGTTYGELETVTGLGRQSLVYAFGDKRKLFEKALRLYADQRVEDVIAQLKAPGSPLTNVRCVFDMWLDDAANTEHPGCLLVNTAGEFGSSQIRYSEILKQASGRLIKAFEATLRNAQTAGEIGEHLDPASLAHLAVAAGDGALLHARVRKDAAMATQTFQALMDLMTS